MSENRHRHECSLYAFLNGYGDESGIRCLHGFLVRPGDQIESRTAPTRSGPFTMPRSTQGTCPASRRWTCD